MEKNDRLFDSVSSESMEVDDPVKTIRGSPTATVEPRQSLQVLAAIGRDNDNIADGPGIEETTKVESMEIEIPVKRFCESPKTADEPCSLVLAEVGDDVLVNDTQMVDAKLSSEENGPDGTAIYILEKTVDESTNENSKGKDLPADEISQESMLNAWLKLCGTDESYTCPDDSNSWTWSDYILEIMKQGNNEGHVTIDQSIHDSLEDTDEKSIENADENDQKSTMSAECSTSKDSINDDEPNLNFDQTILKHPAPLPENPYQPGPYIWKPLPPAPTITVFTLNSSGVKLSLTMDITCEVAGIRLFEVYFYEENPLVPPKKGLWVKLTEIIPEYVPFEFELNELPLKCKNPKVHFSVRVVDEHGRKGPFSEPKSTMLD